LTDPKFAAAMILGDAYDRDELKTLAKSLKGGGIDKLFIAYNGKTRSSLTWWFDFMGQIGLPFQVQKFAWEDNFALARQQSFDMVPKDEFQWIMWIDSDDEFFAPIPLKKLVADLDEYSSGLFLRYDYAVDKETDTVIVEQWRERLLRSDVNWQWKHPIHEVCLGPPGTQFAKRDGAFIRHLRTSGQEHDSRYRNRRIIAKAMRENPEEPRYKYYFAGETMAMADDSDDPKERYSLANAAVLAYRQYQEMLPEVTDDFYISMCRIAECYRIMGEHIKAIDADLETIAIYPNWPEGYIGAAKSCMELGDFKRMLAFAEMAVVCPKPRTAASIESMNYTFTPVFLRGLAKEETGDLDGAMKDYETARNHWNPPNGSLDEKIAELQEKINGGERDADLWDVRKLKRGTKPEKSIAFYTNPLPEVWHPSTIETDGAGGSETAVVKIAQRFAADDWRVAVFGTPGKLRGEFEGVEYWDSTEFLPNEKFTVFVSSRSAQPFYADLQAKFTCLWMHDVNMHEQLFPIMHVPNKILGVSNWHAGHLARTYSIPSTKLGVMPNGIDIENYPEAWTDRGPIEDPRFIYSSSPDRGLETLVSLWPVIKRMWPGATLDIFYGWNMFDKAIEMHARAGSPAEHALRQLKDRILNQIQWLGEDSGITQRGRINQKELALWQSKADVWFYPTAFMETFCITAIENQAAGVLPLTSNLAGLKEAVASLDLRIEGWPQNVTYQNEALRRLSGLINYYDESVEEYRILGRKHAEKFSWDASYDHWQQLLRQNGVTV
jgi:glycosyltransferase involved in cell wall biosynthesis